AIHFNKGFRFDTIFIPCVCEAAGYRASSPEALRSGAKLLYDGMTRALRKLAMLYHRPGPSSDRRGEAITDVRPRVVAYTAAKPARSSASRWGGYRRPLDC